MIGIICGMIEERSGVLKCFNKTKLVLKKAGFEFYEVENKAIIASATVGKVSAGIVTTLMIENFPEIDTIINIGITGAIAKDLKHFDVILADKTVQADMDTSYFGDPRGLISGINLVYFNTDTKILEKLKRCAFSIKAHVIVGTQATVDRFVTSKKDISFLRKEFNATSVDMECGAIAQTAYLFNKKFACIRTISDLPVKGNDYELNKKKAIHIISEIVYNYIMN